MSNEQPSARNPNTKRQMNWSGVWKCSRCTFENKMKDDICQMCYSGGRPLLEQVSGLEKERKEREELEGDEVKIVLTRNKWNESLKAMRNLMYFAEKERKKEKKEFEKIGNDILDSIDMLCNNIFYPSLESNRNEKTEEIENTNKNNNKRKHSTSLKTQFCDNFDGIGSMSKRYKIKSLSAIVNDYNKLIYQDFLSINTQLIYGKLENLLFEHSNNKQDIHFLYNKIIRRRNICSMFPFKHPTLDWSKYISDYISLIERLNANNNDKIKMFCILYNCMVNVFVSGDTSKYGGLDRYISNCKDDDDVDLNSLCQWYILVEMVKTGIFGNDKKLMDHKTFYYGKDVYSSSVVKRIISNVFDDASDSIASFKKLLKCCVNDIKYNNNISKLKKIYSNNTADCDYGIQFYVLNRLTYYVYHDLLLSSIPNKNDNLLLFPKLKKFFAFLWNFAIYCHCYVHEGAAANDKAECLFF